MPNRIIKESAFSSDKIASLSDFEFRLWVGLITSADDAGRGDARPAIIKGHVFALRDRVTIKDIENALHGLAAKGCVSIYYVGGKPYFLFPTWAAHQRVRDCKPKFPAPEENLCENSVFLQSAATCGELPQNAALIQSNPIQYESEIESISEIESESIKTTTTTAPANLEILAYFEKHKYAVENYAEEAHKFKIYNEARGWDCLPDWQANADLWIMRAKEGRKRS